MKEYRNYTIVLSLKSPIITSFQADTLFGHICWAVRFLGWEKEDKLQDFLNCYDEEIPPLLVSNGFPKGYLPKPIIPPITQNELEEVIDKDNQIKNSHIIKTIKNIDIITKSDFFQLQKEKIAPKELFEIMLRRYKVIVHETKKLCPVVVQHNTINRMGMQTTQGLYAQEEHFYDFHSEVSGAFEIYLKTNYFTLDELKRIFGYIKEQGYGRDKSTGKGQFDFEINEGIDLSEPETSNAFMSLSSYIPNEKDPTEGNYQILLKYGKLGGHYAKGAAEVNGNPFKKPLIMFSAGSTFYDEQYYNGKIYGQLLRQVHHKGKIRHYAFAFPIGINLESMSKDEI